MKFYVYGIFVDGVLRYIGKGSGWRAKQHLSIAKRLSVLRSNGRKVKASYFHNKLSKALRHDAVVSVEYIATGLMEREAYQREVAEIASRPADQLWNRKSGGCEGAIYSAETRHKISLAALRRYLDPAQLALAKQIATEISNSPEARAKRSKTQARRFAAGEMAYFHAKSYTPEARARGARALSKTLASRPDLRHRVSEWRKTHMQEHAASLKAAHARPDVKAKRRAYYDSPEGRAKLRAAALARWAKVAS